MSTHRRRTMETLRHDLDAANHAPLDQRRLHSFYEACAGTAIGFAVSYALQMFVISPLFNLRTNAGEDFLIVSIFTIASVIRSYGVRRLFNWLHRRNHTQSYPQP